MCDISPSATSTCDISRERFLAIPNNCNTPTRNVFHFNRKWDPNGTGTNIGTRVPLGPRRSPAAGVLRRPRPSALHVRHSYPNALRASPRALGASATPLANPVLLLFFNSAAFVPPSLRCPACHLLPLRRLTADPYRAAPPLHTHLTFCSTEFERTEPPGAPQRPRWARKSARECSAAASLGQNVDPRGGLLV